MSQKQEFFKKIDDKAGQHPLKDRLQEELREHIDDATISRRHTVEQSIERLGAPQRIVRELRNADVSWRRFGIFFLSCSLVFVIEFVVQFRNYQYIGRMNTNFDDVLNLLLNLSPLIGILVPLISSILLVGKRYHFSVGELFWYGFVFGIITNTFLFISGYYLKSIDVILELKQGWVTGVIFGNILSIFASVVFGALAMAGGILRKEIMRRKYSDS